MLNRYRPGERVNDEDGLDLAAPLDRHTENVANVGYGVSHFVVLLTEDGTQCFRIVRTDSSGTDFSYPHWHRATSVVHRLDGVIFPESFVPAAGCTQRRCQPRYLE